MIEHVVMWKFADNAEGKTREENMAIVRERLFALPAIIPEIKSISVNFNCNPNEAWHICLESTFDTIEDLETYANHPDHKAVGAALRPNMAARSCVDYSF